MSRNFKFFINLALFLFSANLAFALTCRNDYSGTSGCADNKTPAGNCETLGYSTANTDNCGHYIYCPFDTNYKRCTTIKNGSDCSDYPLTECPENGICEDCPNDSSYKKLTGCETGYTLNSSGTGCYLYSFKCPDGYSEDIKSVADCGDGTAEHKGWIFSSNMGICGKCIAKTCHAYGHYQYPYAQICKIEKEYLGDTYSECQDCESCGTYGYGTAPVSCDEWCKESVPFNEGKYAINVQQEVTKNGRTGTCFTGYQSDEGTCCCYYGTEDPSKCA